MQAHKLLYKAYKQYKKKLKEDESISKLARDVQIPYSSVYNAIMEKRKCNADIWLTLMKHFGAVEVSKKGVKVK